MKTRYQLLLYNAELLTWKSHLTSAECNQVQKLRLARTPDIGFNTLCTG